MYVRITQHVPVYLCVLTLYTFSGSWRTAADITPLFLSVTVVLYCDAAAHIVNYHDREEVALGLGEIGVHVSIYFSERLGLCGLLDLSSMVLTCPSGTDGAIRSISESGVERVWLLLRF